MKSQELLEMFTAYCKAHPEERFWQALRNWSGYQIVSLITWGGVAHNPFYWESNWKDWPR